MVMLDLLMSFFKHFVIVLFPFEDGALIPEIKLVLERLLFQHKDAFGNHS